MRWTMELLQGIAVGIAVAFPICLLFWAENRRIAKEYRRISKADGRSSTGFTSSIVAGGGAGTSRQAEPEDK